MNRIFAVLLTIVLAAACMSESSARGGRAGGGSRGMSRPSGGMSRPSGGMSRPAGGMSRPPSGVSRPSGGFNLSNDMRPVPRPGAGGGGIAGPGGISGPGAGAIQRPPNGGLQRPGGGTRPPGTVQRPPAGAGGTRPPLTRPPGARPPVPPPRPPGPAWGWNGGIAWYPAPIYWGGGFWGPWAIGVSSAVLFGSIVDEHTHETVTSYEVSTDSPGAKTLAAYELTQKPCGEPNLVVIYGPDNSVVCAAPNTTVAAGTYYLDVSNLTIYSKSA